MMSALHEQLMQARVRSLHRDARGSRLLAARARSESAQREQAVSAVRAIGKNPSKRPALALIRGSRS